MNGQQLKAVSRRDRTEHEHGWLNEEAEDDQLRAALEISRADFGDRCGVAVSDATLPQSTATATPRASTLKDNVNRARSTRVGFVSPNRCESIEHWDPILDGNIPARTGDGNWDTEGFDSDTPLDGASGASSKELAGARLHELKASHTSGGASFGRFDADGGLRPRVDSVENEKHAKRQFDQDLTEEITVIKWDVSHDIPEGDWEKFRRVLRRLIQDAMRDHGNQRRVRDDNPYFWGSVGR